MSAPESEEKKKEQMELAVVNSDATGTGVVRTQGGSSSEETDYKKETAEEPILKSTAGKETKAKETVVGDQKTTDTLLIESASKKMVAKVSGMANWANASMLSVAVGATIEYNTKQKADSTLWSWVYFAVIFALAYVSTIVEHAFDEPQELAQELKVTVPPRSAAKGNSEARAEMKQLKERGPTPAPKTKSASAAAAWKVASFVELESGAFAEAFAELWVATLANVTAMSFNAAMMASFGNLKGEGAVVVSAFLFAMIVSVIAIIVTVYASRALEALEEEIYEELKQTMDAYNMKSSLLKYASKRHGFVLLCGALSFSIGLAWRGVASHFLTSLVSNEATAVASTWLHAFFVSLLVACINTVPMRYVMFTPRHGAYAFQIESKEREMLGKAWHNAVQTLAGLAWADAVFVTLDKVTGKKATVAGMWIAAFVLILLSVCATQFWERMSFEMNASVHGAVRAVYELFPKMYDPSGIRADEDEEEKEDMDKDMEVFLEHSWIRDFVYALISLSLASFAVAAGKSVASATVVTMKLMYKGYYDPDENHGDEVNGKFLSSIWTALFIGFLAWTVILMYLVRLVNAAHKTRREAFAKVKEEIDGMDVVLLGGDESEEEEEDKAAKATEDALASTQQTEE